MRPAAAVLAILGLSACRGRSSRATGLPADEADAGTFAPAPPRAPPPASQCTLVGRQWYADPGSADSGEADLPAIEGLTLATGNAPAAPVWAAWVDSRADRVVLSRGPGRSVVAPLGGGEHTDPVLVLAGAVPALVWVRQQGAARSHVVATDEDLAGRCEQPEGADDGMTVAAAAVHGGDGVLVAWDEDRAPDPTTPGRVAGVVLAQVVPSRGAHGRCPGERPLSPVGQDAGDPVAVALPGGRAAVFWLAAQAVEASDGHDTATDVWGVAVDGEGVPHGSPLRVTSPPARRFGLAVRAAGGAIWLAYRVSAESDNEGRGDGGDVVAIRVDEALTRAGEPVVLTPDDANPTGTPAVVADGRGAEIWWLDRRAEGTVAVRRALDPVGRPTGEPEDEPAVGTEVPVRRAGDEVTTPARRGAGVGVARYRCAWLPRATVPGTTPGTTPGRTPGTAPGTTHPTAGGANRGVPGGGG